MESWGQTGWMEQTIWVNEMWVGFSATYGRRLTSYGIMKMLSPRDLFNGSSIQVKEWWIIYYNNTILKGPMPSFFFFVKGPMSYLTWSLSHINSNYWKTIAGREAHVMTFEVGAVLEDEKWQAPVYCFHNENKSSE